jgi:hypothetical protein
MAALQRAFMGLRSAVLSRMGAAAGAQQLWRGFATASYLDKNEVTGRVLNCVKNFEKVEPNQVRDEVLRRRQPSTPRYCAYMMPWT